MLTPRQAQFIRIGFQTTPGWEELAETNPRFVQALEALPDETILRRCNVMLQEMFDDVKREAYCIELHAEVVLLRDRLNSLRYAVVDVLTEWEERWRRPGDDDPVMEALRKAAGFPGEPPAVSYASRMHDMFDDIKREAFSLAKMSEDCIELHAEVVLLRDRLNSLRYAVADVLTEWEERWRRPGDDDPVMEALRKAAGFPGEPPAVDQIEKGHGDR